MKLTSEALLIIGTRLGQNVPLYVFVPKMITKQLLTVRYKQLYFISF